MSTQMTLSGDAVQTGPGKATHGVCCLLEAMTVDEFDRVLSGDLDVDGLYAKYGVSR